MAPRRHPLLRLWIAVTISIVAAIGGTAWWWEQQLPRKLQEASRDGDFEACLRFGEQLAALRWLGQGAPEEQALCRRRQAERLWASGDADAALTLQRQLVQSISATEAQQAGDRARLIRWENDLRDRSLALFREGQLDAAIAVLKPLETSLDSAGSTLSDTLRQTWNRNLLNYERLIKLVDDMRWWEALDSLNRLDHPWWQKRSEPQRRTIETALEKRGSEEEHQQHGSGRNDLISGEALEREVQVELQAGIDPWDAFQSACRRLGGQVVEDGPESFCRRDGDSGS